MEIFVNDIRVPFFSNITLRFSNPHFSKTGGHSFPVSFPASVPAVQKAFGFPSILEAEILPEIPARIQVQHISLQGYWQVTSASESVIEAYFIGNDSAFYEQIRGKYLTDLTYAGLTRPVGFAASREDVLAYMSTLINATYPDEDYTAYCAYMPNALGEETEADLQFVNPCVGAINPAFVMPDSQHLNSTVYLFVGAVIDYIFSEHNYKIERSIFRTDPDLKTLTLFNNFNRNAYWEFDYRQLVPRRQISEFLEKISATFNIGFFIDNERRSVVIDYFDNLVINKEVSDLKLTSKKNDPSLPAGTTLTQEQVDPFVTHNYRKISDFPGNTAVINYIDTVGEIDPAAIAPGTIYFVRNEETYYIVHMLTISTRELRRLCPDNLPYVLGDGSGDSDEAAGWPGMHTLIEELSYEYSGTQTVNRSWLLPRWDQECNYRKSGFWWLVKESEDFTDFPIMFLFARGRDWTTLEEGEGSPYFPFAYPLATPSVYACDGSKLTGANISMNWRGDYGLVNTVWKNRLAWEMERKRVITAGVTGRDIVKLFDFTKALIIENHNYLVSSFDLELSSESLKVTEVELLRL